MKSNNPVTRIFSRIESVEHEQAMTVQGTFIKLGVLLAIMAISAFCSIFVLSKPLMLIAFAGGIILGLLTAFVPTWAPFTAVPYAVCQGIAVATLSFLAEVRYPGITVAVLGLTTATAAGMALLYRFEIIKVTDTFKAVVLSATAGFALTYIITFILHLFGIPVSLYESSSISSILFSLFAVAIAASNLLLDFALIEESAERRLPYYMEWYSAFAVLVTLVWLYVELLRLVQKFAKRRE